MGEKQDHIEYLYYGVDLPDFGVYVDLLVDFVVEVSNVEQLNEDDHAQVLGHWEGRHVAADEEDQEEDVEDEQFLQQVVL